MDDICDQTARLLDMLGDRVIWVPGLTPPVVFVAPARMVLINPDLGLSDRLAALDAALAAVLGLDRPNQTHR